MDFGFDDLEGSTEYTLKVACRNEVGYSAFTEPVLFETSDYRAPHAPVVISSTKSDKQDLYLLEWMPPNDGGMELISYGIAYTEVIANDVELWETIENIPSYDTQYTINNLKPNTGYQIELWANNKMGKGDVTTVDMTTTAGESVNNPEYHNAGAESILKYSLSLIFICITVAIFKT
uniref:Protein turtle-like n=1 Tax=Saccoglossus kowalevskii TaxID=10224 RepID=A0ABM0H0I4_SACKO|nr:PREDICTED: protein turtle-like [Saccoglossus kowalevskii]